MQTGGAPRQTRADRSRFGAGLAVLTADGRGTAWLCTLFALALRVLYLLESADNPFRRHFDLDPRNYHEWALAILGGRVVGPEPFFQAPLYPYLLACIYGLGGPQPAIVYGLQAVLGAATVYLGARTAHLLWGRPAALTTGLALALYPPALFYTGILLVPVVATFLLALALWLAPRRAFTAGIAAGLAGLAHPTVLPGALLAVLGLRLHGAGDGALGRGSPPAAGRGRLRAAGRVAWPVLAGALLALAPATLYNLAVAGRFIPISINSGINLFIGNGPQANGFYRSPFGMRGEEDPLGIREAGRLAGRPLTAVEANRYWTDRTHEHVALRPGAALALFARKVHFALAAYETPQIESFDFEKRFSFLLRLPLPGWLALLALATAGAVLRRREIVPWALLLGLLANTLVLAIYFVTARFRMPSHLLLALGAGAAAAALVAHLRDGRSVARLAPAAAALGLTLLLFAPNWMGVAREITFGQYHHRLGVLAERAGEIERARAEYEEALRIDPGVARAQINLGLLAARAGDLERARGLLERGLALDPRSARAHLGLGQIHQVRGDLAAACSLYRAAASVDSTFTAALDYLLACEYLRGDIAAAEATARRLTRPGESQESARPAWLLARIDERRRWLLPLGGTRERREGDLALAAGQTDRAEAAWRAALVRDRDDLVAMIELARLAARRDDAPAVAAWRGRFLESGGRAEAFLALVG